jgi:hypothetical protein
MIYNESLKALKEHGFKRVELSWILEDNHLVQRIIETVQDRLYQEYRIYEKNI